MRTAAISTRTEFTRIILRTAVKSILSIFAVGIITGITSGLRDTIAGHIGITSVDETTAGHIGITLVDETTAGHIGITLVDETTGGRLDIREAVMVDLEGVIKAGKKIAGWQ